jgi:hypothetical protein
LKRREPRPSGALFFGYLILAKPVDRVARKSPTD